MFGAVEEELRAAGYDLVFSKPVRITFGVPDKEINAGMGLIYDYEDVPVVNYFSPPTRGARLRFMKIT